MIYHKNEDAICNPTLRYVQQQPAYGKYHSSPAPVPGYRVHLVYCYNSFRFFAVF